MNPILRCLGLTCFSVVLPILGVIFAIDEYFFNWFFTPARRRKHWNKMHVFFF